MQARKLRKLWSGNFLTNCGRSRGFWKVLKLRLKGSNYALFKGLCPYRFSGGAGRSAGTSWVGCGALRRFRKFLKGFNFLKRSQ